MMKKYIDKLGPSGGTMYSYAINFARTVFENSPPVVRDEYNQERKKVMMFLSDGDPQPRLRVAPHPDVAKYDHVPLNLVLIRTQHCLFRATVFRDRVQPVRSYTPTFPLGAQPNRNRSST